VRAVSFHHLVTEILAFLPFILQGAIAFVMIRRKLISIFPFFFSYTAVIESTGLVLIFLPYNHRAYSLVYWASETLAILLGFAVIFEILRHILPLSPSLMVLLNVVVILAVLAALIAINILVWAKPGAQTDWLLNDIVLAERCLRFLQASLLIVMIALMSVLALTWHHKSLGILAGFGVYSAVALVVYEFGYHLHLMSTSAFLLLNSAGYNVAVLIWAFYLLRSPTRPSTPSTHLEDAELAGWINALSDEALQWSQTYKRSL
jgi:hypothetical protein